MSRGEGFWFTRDYELVPIYDHLLYLEEIDRKAEFFPDTLTRKDEKIIKQLGTPEPGWTRPKPGEVKSPSKRRERVLLEAMKQDWIRIRRHPERPHMVFEFWQRGESAFTAAGLALKKMGVPEFETVELHAVETDEPFLMTAGDLYAYMRGEVPAEIGFSVRDNPKGKGKKR